MTLSFPPPRGLNKMMLLGVFCCRLANRQHTEFLKTDSESFPDGSGHIFNFCQVNGNGKHLSTQSLKKDEIVFRSSQYERGEGVRVSLCGLGLGKIYS